MLHGHRCFVLVERLSSFRGSKCIWVLLGNSFWISITIVLCKEDFSVVYLFHRVYAISEVPLHVISSRCMVKRDMILYIIGMNAEYPVM